VSWLQFIADQHPTAKGLQTVAVAGLVNETCTSPSVGARIVDADIAGVEVISPANKQAYTVPNRCDFFDFATLEQQKAHIKT